MGFVVAYSKATGRQSMVPEHFFDQPELCRDLTRDVPAHVEVPGDEQPAVPASAATAAPAQPQQSPRPSSDWTVAGLRAYAGDNSIDLGGATTKKPILAAIQDALAAAEPDNPALDAIGVAHPGPGGETATQDADASDQNPADISPTETPATGEIQE